MKAESRKVGMGHAVETLLLQCPVVTAETSYHHVLGRGKEVARTRGLASPSTTEPASSARAVTPVCHLAEARVLG